MAAASFTNPQEAEQAFYEAFQRADLDALMAVWAEDEEVYCVHPGGPRLTGLDSIRESFRRLFRGGSSMRFQLRGAQQMRGGLLAVHSVYEYITLVGERRPASAVIATNVYVNVGGGWRMLAHHGSAVAGSEAQPPAEAASPGMLH
ncbi:MAG: nuclear transport factor 2 family protein [Burkholderiales bacterium]|nr:nuclear transport factor 2 family protein [Burkholderiales bacterium]